MKKLLSILLTLCLLIAVTVIPVPAMAASGEITFEYGSYGTTESPVSYDIGETIDYPELPAHSDGSLVWSLYTDAYEAPPAEFDGSFSQVYAFLLEGVFNFESYSPDSYIKWSGRVQPLAEPGNTENTVIQFNNNGIPYQSEEVAKSVGYSNSGLIANSTYTKFADTELGVAAGTAAAALKSAFEKAIANGGYANYYNATANDNTYDANREEFESRDSYNSIELNQLEANTTYKVTINYKRISLGSNLYIMPATWAASANQRGNTTSYNDARITIPAGTDSDYETVSTIITTPEEFKTTTGTNGTVYTGDVLRLILFTGVQYANNVVYFDDITVEEVVVAKLTYHNADGTTKEVNLESGSTIDYLALAPNKLGENGGVWYADAQGTTPAPAVMPAGNLDVYEVVQTGVFDFNNYYRYEDYTGDKYGINDAAVLNSIYADGYGNILVDTSKYITTSNGVPTPDKTNAAVGTLRKYVIAIGEAEASTDYKITVEYSYTATNDDQRLVLTPLTGYGTLTYTNVNGKDAAIIIGDSVELPQGTNQSIDLFYSSADEFYKNGDKDESDYRKAETDEVANSFYLNVKTTVNSHDAEANVVNATISKVTVVEYVAPAKTFTVTLNRGGVTEEVSVEEGTEYTLPDTEFTDTSWWSSEFANQKVRFVGYEGEKVTVTKDITYYTAETYSDGKAGIYRNWNDLDTTTEAFSYFYKTDTSTNAWAYNGSTRVCTRLGVVEENISYRISVTYKAKTSTDIGFYMLTTAITNSADVMRNYLEGGKAFHVVEAGTDTNGWTTATFYITADLPGEITESTNGLDDTKTSGENCGLYLTLGKDSGSSSVEIAIKETKVEKLGEVVGATGASVLTDAAAQEEGKQAIRYYFNYKTENEGADIVIGSQSYEVVERGFIITNGAINNYGCLNTTDNKYYYYFAGNSEKGYATEHFMINLSEAKDFANIGTLSVKSVSGDDLKKMWSLDGDTVTFSNYLINIPEAAYNAKFIVKGYVTFKDADGNEHTVYSKTVNRSVNGIANVLNERH